MIEETIVTKLQAMDLGVQGVHSVRPPQSAPRPHIVYSVIDREEHQHAQGLSGKRLTAVRIECRAETSGEARSIAAKIARPVADGGLIGFKGTLSDEPIDSILHAGEADGAAEPPAGAGDTWTYVRQVDLDIQHGTAIAVGE